MKTISRKAGVLLRVGFVAAVAASGLICSFGASATDARLVVAQVEKPTGAGTINAVDATARKINMTHGPIAALKWDGMTMDFGVAPGVDLKALRPGAKVRFTLGRGADGMYVIESVGPAE